MILAVGHFDDAFVADSRKPSPTCQHVDTMLLVSTLGFSNQGIKAILPTFSVTMCAIFQG